MREKQLEAPRAKEICEHELELTANSKEQLPVVVDAIVESCEKKDSMDNVYAALMPWRKEVADILNELKDLLYPGYFRSREIRHTDLTHYIGNKAMRAFNRLSLQISLSVGHECVKFGEPCTQCLELGQAQAIRFLKKIPKVREMLAGDVKAALDRDPAARSFQEIVLSYPGVLAITIYRLAHELWLQEVYLIARMMTEHAHSITGIDIHPGATIGSDFFIDHGTGVVIGESTVIGNNVTIYQGVTLGAYKFRRTADGSLERAYKRHPTVGDNVIIYSGATILGGDTVIGARSVIGGNVWLTHSVPADAVVTIKRPDLKYKVGY